VKVEKYDSFMPNISDLIKADFLAIGTKLVWKRRNGQGFTAEVVEGGFIKTTDGVSHKTPSGAARSLIGRPIDGWAIWRLNDGTTLGELRSKLPNK